MANITASMVKELREATNVGMMECKKALQEADGNKDKAIQLLRERGLAIASKKSSRTANQGLVDAEILDDGKAGIMIEVNCETDFVARNENFQAYVKELLEKAKHLGEGELAEAEKESLTAKVAEIGENLIIHRNTRLECSGPGRIAAYIHLGGKVGVLVEVGCEKEETAESDVFKELCKDLTLHIAAANPQYLTQDDVPADVIEQEKAIFAKQVEGKPAEIIDKIVGGKLNKHFSQICLVDQEFVKDTDMSISKLLEAKGKELNDTLGIRRFVRYQIGG